MSNTHNVVSTAVAALSAVQSEFPSLSPADTVKLLLLLQGQQTTPPTPVATPTPAPAPKAALSVPIPDPVPVPVRRKRGRPRKVRVEDEPLDSKRQEVAKQAKALIMSGDGNPLTVTQKIWCFLTTPMAPKSVQALFKATYPNEGCPPLGTLIMVLSRSKAFTKVGDKFVRVESAFLDALSKEGLSPKVKAAIENSAPAQAEAPQMFGSTRRDKTRSKGFPADIYSAPTVVRVYAVLNSFPEGLSKQDIVYQHKRFLGENIHQDTLSHCLTYPCFTSVRASKVCIYSVIPQADLNAWLNNQAPLPERFKRVPMSKDELKEVVNEVDTIFEEKGISSIHIKDLLVALEARGTQNSAKPRWNTSRYGGLYKTLMRSTGYIIKGGVVSRLRPNFSNNPAVSPTAVQQLPITQPEIR